MPQICRASAATFTVVDQIIVSGSNVLLGILLARWLGRADFGVYAVLFSSFTLVVGFHNALLIEPLSVFGGGLFRGSLAAYMRRCVGLHALLIVAMIPVAILLGSALSPPGYSAIGFSVSLLAAGSFFLLYLLLRRIAYTGGMQRQALAAGIVNLIVTLSSLAIARGAGTLSWTSGLIAQASGGFVGASLLWLLIRRSDIKQRDGALSFDSVLKHHWSYGRWSVCTALMFWFSADAYSVLVGRFLGAESAAGFRTVLNVTMFLPNFLAALSVLILPRAAGLFYDGKHSELRRLIDAFAVLSLMAALAGAVILWVEGPRVVGMVYGAQYRAAAGILPPLLVNMALLSVSQAFQTQIRAGNEPQRIFKAFLAAAVCTCTIGLGLTWGYKLQGAALGLCCSTICFVVFLAPWRLTSGYVQEEIRNRSISRFPIPYRARSHDT